MSTTESNTQTAPPDFLTVEEAGAVLRLGRTTAYRLARKFLATNGADGIPTVRYGKQMRVPRAAIERDLGGPITWPIEIDEVVEHVVEPIKTHATSARAKRQRPAAPEQSSLPFPA
ncbi:MAG: hypothetical protein JWM34_1918 [Ilumatobacteraceae bacterium]|nr:hypothetical protein [Ilumatobacteraceae bacterium]